MKNIYDELNDKNAFSLSLFLSRLLSLSASLSHPRSLFFSRSSLSLAQKLDQLTKVLAIFPDTRGESFFFLLAIFPDMRGESFFFLRVPL